MTTESPLIDDGAFNKANEAGRRSLARGPLATATACHKQVQALNLQELCAAIAAGAASGAGVNAEAVFDRLTQKYQAAANADKGVS